VFSHFISMRPRLLLLMVVCRSAMAAPTVYLSERGECPNQETLLHALQDHLVQFDASPAPRAGSHLVSVLDLGRRYRVIVDGEARDFDDPGRHCGERAATATVFIALTLEPPSLISSPTPTPSPEPPAPVAPILIPIPPPIVAPLPPPRPKLRRVETQILVGTSLGILFQGAHADTAWEADPANDQYQPASVGASGAASEPLHVGMVLGCRLHKLTALDLYARIGAPLVNDVGKSTADFALILRDRFIFGDGAVHPYVTAGLGAGWIHHDVDFASGQTDDQPLVDAATARDFRPSQHPATRLCSAQSCIDTVTMGYFLLQWSTGLQIDLMHGRYGDLTFLTELQLLAAPFQNTGINWDFHFGLGAAY
jgi:hypothetical protein